MFSSANKTTKTSPAVQQTAGTTFFRKAGEESFFGAKETPSFFKPAVQAKLTVSTPDDPQEKEADAVAEKVMRMPEPIAAAPLSDQNEEKLQRKEGEIQAKQETPLVDRIQCKQEPGLKIQAKAATGGCGAKEDTHIHTKSQTENNTAHNRSSISLYPSDVMRQSGRGPPATSVPFEQTLASSKGGGSALPGNTQQFMESRFNADFSGVRIHTDSTAASLSRSVNAQAFAHGSDIYFNSGKFSPDSTEGKTLLAHELTHTLQQGATGSLHRSLADGPIFLKNGFNNTADHITLYRKQSSKSKTPATPVTEPPSSTSSDTSNTPSTTAPSTVAPNATTEPAPAIAPPVAGSPEPDAQAQAAPASASPVSAPVASASPPAATGADGGGDVSSPEYEQFALQAEAQRKSLRDHATVKKQDITKGAENEKLAISQQVEDEATRLGAVYDDTIIQINNAINNARTEINTNKETKVAQVTATAQVELDKVDNLIVEKQAAVKKVAEQKSTELKAIGENEAKRALDGSTVRVASANELKARKIAEVRGKNNDAQLISGIESEAAKVIADFNKAGGELASAARSRALEGTGNFTKEGEDAASKFSEPKEKARTAITGARDETIKAIGSAASDSLTELTADAKALTEKMQAEKAEKLAQVRANAESIAAGVDNAANEAKAKVDAKTIEVDEEAMRFKDKITEVKWAGPEIDTAALDMQIAVDQHNAEMDTLVSDVIAAIGKGITESVKNLAEAITGQMAEVVKVGAEFETKSSEASTKVVNAMEEQRTKGDEEIKKPGLELGDQLQLAIDRAGEGWSRNLDDARNDIISAVNSGLRKQDDAMAAFDNSLSGIVSKAGSILSGIADALYDFGSFLVGVVVGAFWDVIDFFVAIWNLVKEPLFWFVVAVVALVIVIAIIYFGWAAVAGALAVIGKALVVIGIVIGVGLALYYIYIGFTKPDLSPYERGKYVGKAVVEALLAFAGTGVWAKLTGWMSKVVRIGEVLDLVGDLVKASKLLRKVGEVETVLQLLDKVKDADKLLQLLDKVKDAGEALKLLEKTTDIESLLKLLDLAKADKILTLLEKVKNAAKALELMEEVKNIDTLLSILGKTTDIENLLKLLKAVKDADKVLALLGKSTDIESLLKLMDEIKNAEKILALLEEINDAKKLLELYAKVKDADRLLALAKKVKDTKKLEALLEKVTDAEQLERLLNAVDDVADLEKLLKDMSAAEIDQFINDLKNADKFRIIAKKYVGQALTHYGAEFFKDFAGVDKGTIDHLSVIAGITQKKGITGCHDEAMFLAEMAKQPEKVKAPPGSGRGPITSTAVHPADAAIKKFTYQMWAQDGKGNLASPLVATNDVFYKTTIQGLASNPGTWQALANQAVEHSINTLNFPKGVDGNFTGIAGNGLKWFGWYRGKSIDTIFVVF